MHAGNLMALNLLIHILVIQQLFPSFFASLTHAHDILKVAIFHFANCNQPRNYSSSDSHLDMKAMKNIFIAPTFGNEASTNGNFIKFMKQSAFFSVLLNQQESARNFCSLSLFTFFSEELFENHG